MKQKQYENFKYSSNQEGLYLSDKTNFQKCCELATIKFSSQISIQTSSSIYFLSESNRNECSLEVQQLKRTCEVVSKI